jgi:transcriptional regulator of nitric oxide reductase
MTKSGLLWLVAITSLALGAPELMAQTDINKVKASAVYDACSKSWTISWLGELRLDKADMSVLSFTIEMKDPNNTNFVIPAANITWVAPKPGESKPFTAFSDPVTVKGFYEYKISMTYVDSMGFPQLAQVKLEVEAK